VFQCYICFFLELFLLSYLMNALFLGSSTANECTFSYSTKTTRSTVSCDSLNISGTFDVLGNAACYEFGKPWVCCLIFCKTFISVSNSFFGRVSHHIQYLNIVIQIMKLIKAKVDLKL
jgi:hypothetical protein